MDDSVLADHELSSRFANRQALSPKIASIVSLILFCSLLIVRLFTYSLEIDHDNQAFYRKMCCSILCHIQKMDDRTYFLPGFTSTTTDHYLQKLLNPFTEFVFADVRVRNYFAHST
jgi:hypothetical protein